MRGHTVRDTSLLQIKPNARTIAQQSIDIVSGFGKRGFGKSGFAKIAFAGALLTAACALPEDTTVVDHSSARALGVVDFDPSYTNIIDQFVLARLHRLGIEPHYATNSELIRRMALDLTGRVPRATDYDMLSGVPASQIATFYMSKPGFIEISQIVAADELHYSDDVQFSTPQQLEALNTIVADLYKGVIGYDEYVAQVIGSKAFLSRFTSSADRCTATFIAFLGYEPVTQYDYQFGNIFNPYELSNRRAEQQDDDYHDYVWTGQCDRRATGTEVETCTFDMWGYTGSTPAEGAQMLSGLPVFAEHAADVVWRRFVGSSIDAVAPELAVRLGDFYVEHDFDTRRLILEVVTSAAYLQSHDYRTDDLVLQ